MEWIWPKCINWNYFFAHFIDPVCKTKEFQCLNGGCIPAAYVCDIEKDCQDGSDEIDCQSGEKLWAPLNWDLLEYMYLIEIFFSSDATRLPRKWWYQYCQCWYPNNYNLPKWKRWWEETKWPNHNHYNDPFHFNITTSVRYVK